MWQVFFYLFQDLLFMYPTLVKLGEWLSSLWDMWEMEPLSLCLFLHSGVYPVWKNEYILFIHSLIHAYVYYMSKSVLIIEIERVTSHCTFTIKYIFWGEEYIQVSKDV